MADTSDILLGIGGVVLKWVVFPIIGILLLIWVLEKLFDRLISKIGCGLGAGQAIVGVWGGSCDDGPLPEFDDDLSDGHQTYTNDEIYDLAVAAGVRDVIDEQIGSFLVSSVTPCWLLGVSTQAALAKLKDMTTDTQRDALVELARLWIETPCVETRMYIRDRSLAQNFSSEGPPYFDNQGGFPVDDPPPAQGAADGSGTVKIFAAQPLRNLIEGAPTWLAREVGVDAANMVTANQLRALLVAWSHRHVPDDIVWESGTSDVPGTIGARVSASDTPMCAAGHVVNGVDFAYGAGKPYKYRIRCVKAPEGLTAVDGVAFGARPSGSGYASSTAANPGTGGDFPRFQSVGFLQYDGLPGSRYTLPIGKISASSADATNASTVSVDIGPIGPVPGQQNMTALCPEGTTVHSAGINASGKVTLKCSVPAS